MYITSYLELPEFGYSGWTCVFRSEEGIRFSSGLWPTEEEAIEKVRELAASIGLRLDPANFEGKKTPKEMDAWVAANG